jgi:hypothetical protein
METKLIYIVRSIRYAPPPGGQYLTRLPVLSVARGIKR